MTFNPASISIHMHATPQPDFQIEPLGTDVTGQIWRLVFREGDTTLATVFLSPDQLNELARKLVDAAHLAGFIVTRTERPAEPSVTLDKAREWLENMGYATEFVDKLLNELLP